MKKSVLNYENINIQTVSDANDGILEVIKNEVNYFFLLHLKVNNPKAIVFSNGAYNPEKLSKPVFMRKTWKDDYDTSCIFVDDRTLHNTNLRIGWGIGNEEVHHLEEMSSILIKILSVWDVKPENTIYFGSSAGGFKSIMFATFQEDSTAIVNNPQMLAHKYLDGKSAEILYKTMFPNLTPNEIHEKYGIRFSVAKMMSERNYIPNVLSLFNRMSHEDHNNQYLNFIEECKLLNLKISNIRFLMYSNYETSHDFLSREKTADLLNNIINR